MDHSLLLDIALILGRFVVGGMLVLAGLLKLKAGPHWFLEQILAYELVKGKTAWLLARGLPWAEIICGVLLMIGFLTPLIAVISFVLLWLFTVAVISTFLRSKHIDCGCFGRRVTPQTQKTRWMVIYRNLSLMGLLVIIYSNTSPLSMGTWLSGHRHPLGSSIMETSWLVILWLVSLFSTVVLHLWIQRRIARVQQVGNASAPQN